MGDQHGEHNKLQSTKSEESGAGNTTEKLCFIIRKKNEKIQKINLQLADKDDVIGEPELICIVLYVIKLIKCFQNVCIKLLPRKVTEFQNWNLS